MNWIKEQTNSIYGQAPKLKMCRKKFERHSKNSFLVGMIQASETIEKLIRDSSEMSHDELRGEIHGMLQEYLDKSRKLNGSTWKKPTLSKVIDTRTAIG